MRKIYLSLQRGVLSCMLLAFVAFATSCKDDNTAIDTGALVEPGVAVKATLQIDVAPMSQLVETYSASMNKQGAEVRSTQLSINNLWILEFDAAGKCVVSKKIDSYTPGSDLKIELVSGDRMKIYAVANAAGMSFDSKDLAAFQALKFEGKISSVDDIPYVGYAEVSIKNANFSTNDIVLTKIASQISVSYLVAATSPYKVTSLQLKNVPKSIYFAPYAAITKDDVEDKELLISDLDAVHTYFVAENLQGVDTKITNSKSKITDKPAMYVEIGAYYEDKSIATAYDTKFKMYLGANNTNDFNVSRGVSYALTANLRLEDMADGRTETKLIHSPYLQPESNCYMLAPNAEHALAIPVSRVNSFWASAAGGREDRYTIKTDANEGRVKSWVAKIIWQDAEGEIIKIDKATGTSADEQIIISPNGSGLMGNVLVGIYDAEGSATTPLWSWHVWVTDYRPGDNVWDMLPVRDASVVTGSGYTTVGQYIVPGGKIYQHHNAVSGSTAKNIDAGIMDRNLGALSSDKTQYEKTLGMYYQWGRKDPFYVVRGGKISDYGYEIISPNIDFSVVESKETSFTVLNPNKFIAKTGDWKIMADATLWNTTPKSMYDPCPVGWKVAPKNTFETLTVGSYDMSGTYKPYVNRSGALPGTTAKDLADAFQKGYLFFPNVLDMWYPAGGVINVKQNTRFEEEGYILCNTGTTGKGVAYRYTIYDVDEDPDNGYESRLCVDNNMVGNQGRAAGLPIRCVVEKK